jgi:hypothetical protein
MHFRPSGFFAAFGAMVIVTAPAVANTTVTTINSAMIGAIQAQAQRPPLAAREIALVSISVYDAVNAATGLRGESFAYSGSAVWSANPDAAAYAAGFTALSALYPTMAAGFQTQMNSAIDGLGLNAARRAASISLGSSIATSFIAARASDGSAVAQFPFMPDTSIDGYVPVDPGMPVVPGWGQVTPFAVVSNAAFAPPPPPVLGSPEWIAAYNEVKAIGCAGCGTPEQFETAVFWADDGGGTRTPPGEWLQIATNLANSQNLDVFEAARLSAMVGTALADASFAAWNVKYDQFPIWRPVTSINQCTMAVCGVEGDPNWTPAIPTPNFPAYISGHATMGGAGERAIAGYFGTDSMSFCLDPDPMVAYLPTRCYSSLAVANDENGISRIYGGVHWSYDNVYGKATGRSVGDYVVANYFGINAVPEPASWAMLIAGFGLTGAAMRRRRAVAV